MCGGSVGHSPMKAGLMSFTTGSKFLFSRSEILSLLKIHLRRDKSCQYVMLCHHVTLT